MAKKHICRIRNSALGLGTVPLWLGTMLLGLGAMLLGLGTVPL